MALTLTDLPSSCSYRRSARRPRGEPMYHGELREALDIAINQPRNWRSESCINFLTVRGRRPLGILIPLMSVVGPVWAGKVGTCCWLGICRVKWTPLWFGVSSSCSASAQRSEWVKWMVSGQWLVGRSTSSSLLNRRVIDQDGGMFIRFIIRAGPIPVRL